MADADGIMLSERDRAIVRSVLSPFADRIDRVGVFGSRALGSARPASDIDLVIWGDLDARTLARLGTLFGESSLAVSVDVILYGPELAAALRRHIDRAAKTLFTRDDLRADVVRTGMTG
ncbi:nucleotidyltransferase family protein [Sphingomonas melonis]|uniref:Putative nucleotidyltransferase n=1 Tax=Sphingomonas melonis TaxID=152682 RepID=A0A7Y9K127_9SPHN|nr:nucleotidyltransferase domain-containing protein [Sphingomonas melonis]NYD90483.1 putative nucleotidyltransferase [Sphingomonas melonis]